MKTTVYARNEELAKAQIRNKVVFDKIVRTPDVMAKTMDLLNKLDSNASEMMNTLNKNL